MALDPVYRGSCFCGAIRYEARPPTAFCAHCHCTMCQRSNSAGYVTWVGLDKAQFQLVAGSDELTTYTSSEHGTRSFCRVCGSSIFCELSEHPDQIDITLASFLDPIDREPQLHIYFSDRAPWVSVDDELPRLGGKTGTEPL